MHPMQTFWGAVHKSSRSTRVGRALQCVSTFPATGALPEGRSVIGQRPTRCERNITDVALSAGGLRKVTQAPSTPRLFPPQP